jgi:hypothetical protein
MSCHYTFLWPKGNLHQGLTPLPRSDTAKIVLTVSPAGWYGYWPILEADRSTKLYLQEKGAVEPIMKAVFPECRQSIKHLAMLTLLAGLLYLNALPNGFSFDDFQFVVNNQAVHGFSLQNLQALFTSVPNHIEYLPVKDLTYCLDVAIFGVKPLALRLSNLIWYALACCSFYLFLCRLLVWCRIEAPALPLVAGLLFVAHPMHVASVASICQRKDLVSGFLLFTTLICYLAYRQSGRKHYYAVASLLFVMTLLSKATVMTIPLFILALEWFAPPERRLPLWQRFLPVVPLMVVVAVFIKVESFFLLQTGVLSQLYSSTVSPAIRVATALQAVFYYLKLLVWPYPMLMIHDFGFVKQALSPMIMLAGIGNAILIAGIWWLRHRAPLLSIGGIWLLVTLLPVIGLIPSNTLIAERYLFLPLAGFSLMFAACWQFLTEKGYITKRMALAALVAIILVFSALTIKRNYDWKDNLTLLLANARDLPGKSGVYYQIGAEYFTRGEMGRVLEYLGKAKELNSFYGIHYAVYSAIMAYQAGNLEQAGVILDSIQHPLKLQVVEVNYLYGKIRQSAGDLTNSALYYRNAGKSSLPLGLIKPGDIADALKSLSK